LALNKKKKKKKKKKNPSQKKVEMKKTLLFKRTKSWELEKKHGERGSEERHGKKGGKDRPRGKVPRRKKESGGRTLTEQSNPGPSSPQKKTHKQRNRGRGGVNGGGVAAETKRAKKGPL